MDRPQHSPSEVARRDAEPASRSAEASSQHHDDSRDKHNPSFEVGQNGVSSTFWRRLAPLAIVLIVIAAYCNSLTNSFIFDDNGGIVQNPNIRRLWPLGVSMSAPPGTGASGRPVAAFTLALNYALGGLNPLGYHLFNIAVHAGAALALFGLIRRTLRLARGSADAKSIAATDAALALAVAAIWAAHPLHTSAINHVVYRNEVLMGCFYLLTLYCTARAIAGESPLWFMVAWIACALGMGSKEAMVSAPVAAALYDYAFAGGTMPVRARIAEMLRRRGWFYLGLMATWAVLIASIMSGDRGETVGISGRVTPLNYFYTQLGVVAHYLRLSLWPHPLAIDYQDWPIANSPNDIGPFGFAVLLLAFFSLWLFVRNPRLGFAAVVFFMVLAPTSSFIPLGGAIVGEHRMYLPLAAVALYATLSLAALVGEARAMRGVARRGMKTLIGATPVFAALAATTFARNTAFRTEESFYRDVIAKRPQNARAHYNLGSVLAEQKRLDEAVEPMRAAWRLDPTRLNVLEDLLQTLATLGRTAELAEALADGAARLPKNTTLQLSAARAMVQQKREYDSVVFYYAYLDQKPDDAGVWSEIGQVLLRLRVLDDARLCFDRVLKLQPRNWIALGNLAAIATQQQKPDDALRIYDAALAIQPRNAELLYGRVGALSVAGRWPEVVRELESLIELSPSPVYMSQLCATLSTNSAVKDIDRAIRWGEQAVERTNRGQAEALDVLAYAYAAAGRFSDATQAATEAFEIAQHSNNKELTSKLLARLERYKSSLLPEN
ncbi:MAG: tetratricopeptide repeat protein [Phycisphaerales bacterium]|nr:tetratricopeptide repeat protein [Phycisphaerales bacterium]